MEKYKLRPESKYLAIEIFHKFIIKYLRKKLRSNEYKHKTCQDALDIIDKPKKYKRDLNSYDFEIATKTYRDLAKSFGNDLMVWTLCSIQLASKLTSSKRVIFCNLGHY